MRAFFYFFFEFCFAYFTYFTYSIALNLNIYICTMKRVVRLLCM